MSRFLPALSPQASMQTTLRLRFALLGAPGFVALLSHPLWGGGSWAGDIGLAVLWGLTLAGLCTMVERTVLRRMEAIAAHLDALSLGRFEETLLLTESDADAQRLSRALTRLRRGYSGAIRLLDAEENLPSP